LAFPLILIGIISIFGKFTGGEVGLAGISRLSNTRLQEYYVIVGVTLVCLFVMYKFVDAESKWVRTGIVLRAIREDEITARASGIDTTRYKMLSFGMSGLFAGISGGLYVHLIRVAGPTTLDLAFSFQPILWTVFGGMATLFGAIFGAFVLYPLVEILRLHPVGEQARFLVYALVLIFTLLYMPQGIFTWILDKIEDRCPRCKVINFSFREHCRVCSAPLHLRRSDEKYLAEKRVNNEN
jgi:branched-chain amino acid transport system permease protein